MPKVPVQLIMGTERVAIYVRVSTNEQDTEPQEMELRQYVASRGWTYEIYRDKGQSAAKSERPELTRLLADLRKAKAGHCCRLDTGPLGSFIAPTTGDRGVVQISWGGLGLIATEY